MQSMIPAGDLDAAALEDRCAMWMDVVWDAGTNLVYYHLERIATVDGDTVYLDSGHITHVCVLWVFPGGVDPAQIWPQEQGKFRPLSTKEASAVLSRLYIAHQIN